jgi:O-antigen ligase
METLATVIAIASLLAFGFIFRLVSVEERRNFLRTFIALLLVAGLLSYFAHPLIKHEELKKLLNLTTIIAFTLSMVFLLGYLKLDARIRRGSKNKF